MSTRAARSDRTLRPPALLQRCATGCMGLGDAARHGDRHVGLPPGGGRAWSASTSGSHPRSCTGREHRLGAGAAIVVLGMARVSLSLVASDRATTSSKRSIYDLGRGLGQLVCRQDADASRRWPGVRPAVCAIWHACGTTGTNHRATQRVRSHPDAAGWTRRQGRARYLPRHDRSIGGRNGAGATPRTGVHTRTPTY
jgi:hypothetical protein